MNVALYLICSLMQCFNGLCSCGRHSPGGDSRIVTEGYYLTPPTSIVRYSLLVALLHIATSATSDLQPCDVTFDSVLWRQVLSEQKMWDQGEVCGFTCKVKKAGCVWVQLQKGYWWATSFFFLHEWGKKTVFQPCGADNSGFFTQSEQLVIG